MEKCWKIFVEKKDGILYSIMRYHYNRSNFLTGKEFLKPFILPYDRTRHLYFDTPRYVRCHYDTACSDLLMLSEERLDREDVALVLCECETSKIHRIDFIPLGLNVIQNILKRPTKMGSQSWREALLAGGGAGSRNAVFDLKIIKEEDRHPFGLR